MNKKIIFALLFLVTLPVGAQQVLTLDSCRAMALRNNKQLSVSKVQQLTSCQCIGWLRVDQQGSVYPE